MDLTSSKPSQNCPTASLAPRIAARGCKKRLDAWSKTCFRAWPAACRATSGERKISRTAGQREAASDDASPVVFGRRYA